MNEDKQGIDICIENKVEYPKSYKVLMLNDDYTTQDFVVEILEEIFHKDRAEATTLMFSIHNEGRAAIGIYSYDIAVSKVKKTTTLARKAGFPLRCLIEEV
ncbi:MAG: ATP-dependent Clp protease adaptor ClpS [Spirochaetota bacterium]